MPQVPRIWAPGRPQPSTIHLSYPNQAGTLSYTYYPTGKVETINSSNAHGAWVGYTLDDQNRLSTVVDGNLQGENTTTYTYNAATPGRLGG